MPDPSQILTRTYAPTGEDITEWERVHGPIRNSEDLIRATEEARARMSVQQRVDLARQQVSAGKPYDLPAGVPTSAVQQPVGTPVTASPTTVSTSPVESEKQLVFITTGEKGPGETRAYIFTPSTRQFEDMPKEVEQSVVKIHNQIISSGGDISKYQFSIIEKPTPQSDVVEVEISARPIQEVDLRAGLERENFILGANQTNINPPTIIPTETNTQASTISKTEAAQIYKDLPFWKKLIVAESTLFSKRGFEFLGRGILDIAGIRQTRTSADVLLEHIQEQANVAKEKRIEYAVKTGLKSPIESPPTVIATYPLFFGTIGETSQLISKIPQIGKPLATTAAIGLGGIYGKELVERGEKSYEAFAKEGDVGVAATEAVRTITEIVSIGADMKLAKPDIPIPNVPIKQAELGTAIVTKGSKPETTTVSKIVTEIGGKKYESRAITKTIAIQGEDATRFVTIGKVGTDIGGKIKESVVLGKGIQFEKQGKTVSFEKTLNVEDKRKVLSAGKYLSERKISDIGEFVRTRGITITEKNQEGVYEGLIKIERENPDVGYTTSTISNPIISFKPAETAAKTIAELYKKDISKTSTKTAVETISTTIGSANILKSPELTKAHFSQVGTIVEKSTEPVETILQRRKREVGQATYYEPVEKIVQRQQQPVLSVEEVNLGEPQEKLPERPTIRTQIPRQFQEKFPKQKLPTREKVKMAFNQLAQTPVITISPPSATPVRKIPKGMPLPKYPHKERRKFEYAPPKFKLGYSEKIHKLIQPEAVLKMLVGRKKK